MKLLAVHVHNFRSIEDSGEFAVGKLTCLVGKNEAGKTAILHALRGLSPLDDFKYERTRDYPRRWLTRFDERHPEGSSEVVRTRWQLEPAELKAVEAKLGPGALSSDIVEVTKSIDKEGTVWSIAVDEAKVLEHLQSKHKLDAAERSVLRTATSVQDMYRTLEAASARTEKHDALLADVKTFRKGDAMLAAIDTLRLPKFFYTSHFERMSGEIALNKLAEDKRHDRVSKGDQIFLDFLEYAGTSLEELQGATKHEELVAQCEGASNDITDEIFDFWSQNEALAVKIELGPGLSNDPPPFNSGLIAKIRVENQNHRVTVPLSERSAGFIWFFSFLAQFKQLKKTAGKAILLLDEPGLTLHGKAQADLLRYIEERLLPDHQVIFTTHSPFMVPANRLEDVRVVEDVVEVDGRGRKVVRGTKVSADVLSVDRDTLFPLQAHLGYEITQSLFIGKHTLLVEGPSDVVYLQVLSQALKARGRTGLDPAWVICPTGGLDKVWSFASLFGGNRIDVAVLTDYGAGDKGKVERLRQSTILKTGRVLSIADFTDKAESDIEDLFAPALYQQIANGAYGLTGANTLDDALLTRAAEPSPRLVKQVEAAFRLLPATVPEFDHYTPAAWLQSHPELLEGNAVDVEATLDRAEQVCVAVNAFLER